MQSSPLRAEVTGGGGAPLREGQARGLLGLGQHCVFWGSAAGTRVLPESFVLPFWCLTHFVMRAKREKPHTGSGRSNAPAAL